MKLMLSSPEENIQLQLRFLSLSYTNDATDKHTEFRVVVLTVKRVRTG